jgi:hypothetical protein
VRATLKTIVSRCLAGVIAVMSTTGIWIGPADAGGFEYGTDNGALAVGRGGAAAAIATPSALYSNIAGVADTQGSSFYTSGNLVFRQLRFQRLGFREIEDESRPFVGPMVAAAFRLTPSLVLAIGVHGPVAVGEGHYDRGTLGDPGPSRYLFTDISFFYAIPTVALGFRIRGLDSLRIGIGFQPAVASAAISVYTGTVVVDDPLFDVRVEGDVEDPFVPAMQVGFLYGIGDRVEIGAQVRFSDSIEAYGDAVPVGVPFAQDGGIRFPASRVRLDVPVPFTVLRGGVRYRHPRPGAQTGAGAAPEPHRTELFDVELDFLYESYSSFRRIVVAPLEPVHTPLGVYDVPDLVIQQHWRDTVSLRLGGMVNLLEGGLSLSAGVFWQSAASPLEYTHLVFPAWNSVGVALGVTYRVRVLELTVAYMHIFMTDRHVSAEGGRIFALRASPLGGTFDAPAVNAGDFEGSYDILAFSALISYSGAR